MSVWHWAIVAILLLQVIGLTAAAARGTRVRVGWSTIGGPITMAVLLWLAGFWGG